MHQHFHLGPVLFSFLSFFFFGGGGGGVVSIFAGVFLIIVFMLHVIFTSVCVCVCVTLLCERSKTNSSLFYRKRIKAI